MGKYSVSIIVPVKDEAGTIDELVSSVPAMGKWTEVIFVEGHSSDHTWSEIQKAKVKYQKYKSKFKNVKAYKQREKGKANAIEIGFRHAKGDILMILDADLSVRASELPKFYEVLAGGKAEFVNASRFIFPKEKGAMHFINNTGNICFSKLFSLLFGTPISDTLCGSKTLFRKDYQRIRKLSSYFSGKDPYGDFTLLFGAYFAGLTIKEVPVKYYARRYGKTKISRLRDGLKLLLVLATVLWYWGLRSFWGRSGSRVRRRGVF